MNITTQLLLDGLMFPEAPRWHQGNLWFTDQHARLIKTVNLQGKSSVVAELSDLPGGLGWLPDGRLLVVSMCRRQLLVLNHGKLELFADLSNFASFHCNDLLVDRLGRSYVGNFGYDLHGDEPVTSAEIILVLSDGKVKIVADDVVFPNGMAITPDGKYLIVAETFASRLSAFKVYPDGSLGKHELWADLGEAFPDGICLDQEHAVWVACPNTGEVIRVRQGGEIIDRVTPIGKAYACMLGGDKRTTLFVLSSETDNPEQAKQMLSGRIEIVDVEVPGIGLP